RLSRKYLKPKEINISDLVPLISTETSNLNCYVCNSNVDEGCDGDSVPDVYKVECSARTNPYCRKIIQTGNNR
ncbi:unnamed protein product, partial [Rotaria magnacalcarata]